MGSSEGQTFCLRWNNHKSNLVEILDALIQMECFVDCTIVVDEQVQFKAHRVVLAANSPYFQAILRDVPMDHCSILFPGVKKFEMHALLEYMYTGEVNVTESQIKQIMRIAQQLEVKGLTDMDDLKGKIDSNKEQPQQQQQHQQQTPTTHSMSSSYHHNLSTSDDTEHQSAYSSGGGASTQHKNNTNNTIKPMQTSPIFPSSNHNVTSAAQSSSNSPPYNNYKPSGFPGSLYSRSPVHNVAVAAAAAAVAANDRMPWPISLESSISAHHPGFLSRVYETATDNNPLKRKKLSSMSSMIGTDTPILKSALAQPSAPDSSQTLPFSATNLRDRERRDDRASNGNEYESEKKYRPEASHSPFTDKSMEDDSIEQSPSFSSDSRIAAYVPTQNQKPEWKRYKQYTRSDLDAAIECVKGGMSALQAARKFGVPSRTLYDKVKKMGITTGRPMNRTMKRSPSNGGTPMPFPYGLSGTSHHYADMQSQGLHGGGAIRGSSDDRDDYNNSRRSREREMCPLPPSIPPHAAALLAQNWQSEFSPMQAMAMAAAAHAAANGVATSPGTGARRSPSPNILMKYMRPPSTEIERMHHREEMMEREESENERKRGMEMRERQREHEMNRRHAEMIEREQKGDRNGRGGDRRGDDSNAGEEEVEDLSMSRKNSLKRERSLSMESLNRERSTSPAPLVIPPPTTTVQSSESTSSSPSPPNRPPSSHHNTTGSVIVPPLSQVIQRLTKNKFDVEYNDNNEDNNRELLNNKTAPQPSPLESNQ